ncbi:ribonuclease activity regulator RraA [Roseomonas sp. AR75]|uniref:RraA family protein n=1 Tax=Roseomonas sp. AR75 TaxID=2562311 RepID=UPI00148547BD|nr:ribonuclease activity regulator RraA [Roseomonas sp. AR75]
MTPASASLASVLLKRWGLRALSPTGIAPLDPARCRFAGRAATIRYLPLREDLAPRFHPVDPAAPSHDAIEAVQAGEVLVIEAEARAEAGILGELMALRLQMQGAAAVVCDAGMRDVAALRAMDLPVWCRGPAPASSSATLMLVEHGRPVALGGVTIMQGDWMVGDEDGVVVCPAALWEEALREVEAREALEEYVKTRLARGEPLRGLYPPDAAVQAAFETWRAERQYR